jgi:hypothetical protein
MKPSVGKLLAAGLLLGLAGLALHQHRQIRLLKMEPTESPAPETPAARDAEDRAAEPVPVADTTDIHPPKNPLSTPATATTPALPVRAGSMAEMARMAMTSGMKDLIRAQQKGQMDLLYGSLFKYLELAGVDTDAVRELLLDRQMAILGVAMETMSRELPAREREARMRQTTAGFDARIRELLGPEHYEVYESYEATQAERVQVTLFKNALPPEERLTEDQEDRLILALHEERSRSKVASDDFGARLSDPSRLTAEDMETMLRESAKLREKYVARAASVLTPRQLEQFKASQDQQQALLEMGLKMSASRFAPAAEPAPADAP